MTGDAQVIPEGPGTAAGVPCHSGGLPETDMKPARFAALVIFFTLACPVLAQERDPGDAPAAPAYNKSPREGIKSTAREFGRSVRSGAREVKEVLKNGARQFKRSVAVARCNDGEYSYTHHKTCNHHGGVREQLR